MKKKSTSVALFDIDGTLLDSTQLWAEIPQEYLTLRGISCSENLSEVFSELGYSGTARYLSENYLQGEDYHTVMNGFCQIAANKYRLGINEKPFATKYLHLLRSMHIPCVALTSNMKEIVLPALEQLGMIDCFSDVISIYDIGLDKRSPELYHFVAARLSVETRQCVVFEDAAFAAESAKQAGMTVIGIYDEGSKKNWARLTHIADRVVYDYNELLRENIFPEPALSGRVV